MFGHLRVLAPLLAVALLAGPVLGMPAEPERSGGPHTLEATDSPAAPDTRASSEPTPAPRPPRLALGMDVPSLAYLHERGGAADFGAIWAGAWLQDGGWDDFEALLDEAARRNATPVIHFWYWGDSIGPACVSDGCWDALHGQPLSVDGWRALTAELAMRVEGRGAIVVLESEFNKNGIDSPAYAPRFDALLVEQMRVLQAAGARVATGFGAWAPESWPLFAGAVAQADLVSLQAMRATTRDTEASYRGVVDATVEHAATLRELSGKPVLLSDVALSSHGEGHEALQAETLAALLDASPRLVDAGVVGLVYRAVRDDPAMSLENYFGLAEQHWGFVRADGSAKPALDVWLDAARGSR